MEGQEPMNAMDGEEPMNVCNDVIRVCLGYTMKGDNDVRALLVKQGGRYDATSLDVYSFTAKRRGNFRSAFLDHNPPLPYTAVEFDSSGSYLIEKLDRPSIIMLPTGPSDIQHTLLTESEVDDIFVKYPLIDKRHYNVDACHKNKILMSEREYVLRHAYTPSFLREIKLTLYKKFLTQKMVLGNGPGANARDHIPLCLRMQFIQFDPINWHAWTTTYPNGPDYLLRRHKLIKHILEAACPFIHVAIHDKLPMEKVLSWSLPYGSGGRGYECFASVPRRDFIRNGATFDGKTGKITRKVPTDLPLLMKPPQPSPLVSFSDFFTLTKPRCAMTRAEIECVSNNKRKRYDDDHSNDTKRRSREQEEKQQARQQSDIWSYIAQFFTASTAEYFQKGCVVSVEISNSLATFSTIDFTNFCATIACKYNLDPFITKVLTRLIAARDHGHDNAKAWIVSLLGKAAKEDPFFYQTMKQASVAIMLDTMQHQKPGLIIGVTTDGFMLNTSAMPAEFHYPDGFELKMEFEPDDVRMLRETACKYVGFDQHGDVYHRGFISSRKYPLVFVKIVECLLRRVLMSMPLHLNNTENPHLCVYPEMTHGISDEITGILNQYASRPVDFALPNVNIDAPSTTVDKLPALTFFYNDQCVELFQMYAILDDQTLPTNFSCSELPETLFASCIKRFNVSKYHDIIHDKLEAVARFAKATAGIDATELVQATYAVVTEYIERKLPRDKGVFPGGMSVD